MPSQVSFTLPGSEYQAEAEAIARRRRMAEALQQQAFQPIQMPQQPGVLVSPLSAVAKALKSYTGAQQQKRADEESKALAGRVAQTRDADTAMLANALRGSPATPGGLTEDVAGNVSDAPATPAQTPVQTLSRAIPMLRDPSLQQVAMSGLQGAQQREEQRAFQAGEGEKRAELARELAEMRGAITQDRSPYYQFLQTPTGFMAGNARTGQVSPVFHQGQPVVPAAIDPATQRNLAGAKAGGKEAGEAQAQAQIDLPRVINNANNSLQLIDQMVGSEDGKGKPHPGFSQAVGVGVPGLRLAHGSQTASFMTLLDQVKGGAFLEAFQSLKGGGQITEAEGKKATAAITRMGTAQSEAEFKKAAREYQQVVRLGVQRAQQKAGGTPAATGGVPAGVDPALWAEMTPEEKALWK